MEINELSNLSERARTLLAGPEHYDVEFKESLSGVDSGDFVAFANSTHGGALLIGVREVALEDGRQRGEIIGCDVSDRAKLQVLNRAASCIPPVALEVFVENTSTIPFMRIEIPTGRDKPYCTGGGRYKIRGSARTNTLTPRQLLNIFMESESQRFVERFSRATHELELQLTDTRQKIIADTEDISRKVSLLEGKLEHLVGGVATALSSSQSEADLVQRMQRLEQKLDAILERFANDNNDY